MCDHHHAARHILCPQCDLLVALPQRASPESRLPALRYNVNHHVGRASPASHGVSLVALFMLLLANLFPFIYMKVGGISSEIELLEIPNVLFTEDYASLGTFFYSLFN